MADDPQLELRVTRLEDDTAATYEMLGDIKSTHQEHTRRFEAVDGRLDRMDRRLGVMDGRLDRVEITLAEILRRLPELS